MKYNHAEGRMVFEKNELYQFFKSASDEALFLARNYLRAFDYNNQRYRNLENAALSCVVFQMTRASQNAAEYLNAGGRRPIDKKLGELAEVMDKVLGVHNQRYARYMEMDRVETP